MYQISDRALNFDQALFYSKKALMYESLIEDNKDFTVINNSAGTILNICAILSKLGQ